MQEHPLVGRNVLVVSTNGFVHVGKLFQESDWTSDGFGYLSLTNAKNIRYWERRDGGLPQLAHEGFIPGDKIDSCASRIYLHSIVFIQAIDFDLEVHGTQ